MSNLEKKRNISWALLIVIAVIIMFFVSKWLIEGAYFRKDIVFVYAPLENLYRSLQHSGKSLLWAPEFAGGYPLLATGQLGFVYPIHFILRQFLTAPWVLNLSLLIHALLGGITTFFFLKRNKLHDLAALVGALLFPLGAVIVGKYESMNLILPFMWVPLLLWLLQEIIEAAKPKYFFAWIGVNTLCILVGHIQMAVYILILEGIFVITLTGMNWRHWKRALATLFGVVLVIGITSFYWLPVLDIVPETDRASGTLKPNAQGMFDNQFSPPAFLGLAIPHPFGHHDTYTGPPAENELSNYYGPVALIAGAIGFTASRKKFPLWWPSLVFIIVGLSLATGGYSPLFTWMVAHGWTYFNFPSRFFFYSHVGLVFLIAAGVHVVLSYTSRKILHSILVGAIVIPALWVSWEWHNGVPWKFTKQPQIATLLQQQLGTVRVIPGVQLPGRVLDEFFGMRAWNPICNKCLYRQTFTAPFERIDGIAMKVHVQSKSEGEIALQLYTKKGELLRESRLPHTLFVDAKRDMKDTAWNVFPFSPLKNMAQKELYFELTSTLPAKEAPRVWIHTNPGEQYDPTGRLFDCKTETCKPVLDSDLAFKTIVNDGSVIHYDALAPSVPAGFGLGSMQWSQSLPILKVKDFLSPFDTWGDEFRTGARTMMNRFGTNYLVGVFPPYRYLNMEDFTHIADVPSGDSFLRLYRNDQTFPRLSFAENVRAVVSSIDQVNMLIKTDSKNQSIVLADVPTNKSFTLQGNTARFISDGRAEVEIQTEQTTEGFLVLRDTLLKGWEASIDDTPTPIYRVDGIFRGIEIPPGSHHIRFVYKPAWIRPVIYIESASLTVLICILGYFLHQHHTRKKTSHSDRINV